MLLSMENAYLLPLVFIFTLLIGSFLNVVIHRLPIMMANAWKRECESLLGCQTEPVGEFGKTFNLLLPNSHCPQCYTPIKFYENIPVISYIFLKGRCSHCKIGISWRYPLVEILSALLSVSVAYHFGFSWQSLFALVLTWTLIVLSFIDFDHQLLPDSLTLPVLWLGLLLSLNTVFIGPEESILGAAAGYLSLWTIYQLFKLITGKEGMGYGDFKLLAMLGAWLGWQKLPIILFLSACAGAVLGSFLILLYKRDSQVPFPFGPYLAVAGWISLLWGDQLINWYIDQIRF